MKKRSLCNLLYLVLILFVYSQSYSQTKYTWSDEISLLKQIEKLPEYRDGQLVEQFSSYDRTGGNDDGFSGKYSYLRKENGNLVIAEMEGPGVINRIWTPTPTDDLLSFYFDGEEKPRLEIKFSDLFSGKVYPFTKPVCGNELGGYYCYIPILFNKSCKIVFHGEKIMFHQIQYRKLNNKETETYTGTFSEKDKLLLAEVSNIWADIHPKVASFANGKSAEFKTVEKILTIHPGEEIPFFQTNKPGRIIGMEIDGGTSFEGQYKDIIISAKWDNENVEAIYSPLADFFGYAYGKPAMRSMIMGRQNTNNYCYLPMPFDKSASMKIIYKKRPDVLQTPITIRCKVFYNNIQREIAKEGKLYTIWKRENPEKGKYYEFLKTQGKGHYIGEILQAQGLRPGMTVFFEGDDSTYVDGKMRMHGTGSEDYFNGGWYALTDRWDRGNSLPVHGCLDYSLQMNRTGAYRFFLSDKLSFEKEICHAIEHGPTKNEFPVDYTSVAFFYSDQPLSVKMEPTEELREVYYPTEHVYFPQLMKLTPDGDLKIQFQRGIKMNTNTNGMVRIMLDDLPNGQYKVFINYHEKPEGADFQVWQRQKKLSDWMSSEGAMERLKENIYVGDIELTQQTNSITFHIQNKHEKESQFELNLLTLKRK